jgi:DNA topoisomerase-3
MKIVIAEKPSVGRELAKVFGATTRKDGYIEGNGYSFTWAFGHLLQLAPPQEYGFIGWRRQHLPMLPKKFKLAIRKIKTKDGLVEDPGVRKQLDIIKMLFDEATEIIVATDAGRDLKAENKRKRKTTSPLPAIKTARLRIDKSAG